MPKDELVIKIDLLGQPLHIKKYPLQDLGITGGLAYYDSLGHGVFTSSMTVDEKRSKVIIFVHNEDGTFSFIHAKSRKNYYQNSVGAMIFFNKGDRESFNKVEERVKEYQSVKPQKYISKCIIGLNLDKIEVTTEEGQALADTLNVDYYEMCRGRKEETLKTFQDFFRKMIQYWE